MKKSSYTLTNIMTISTTIWFFVGGFIILVGYFGIKVYLGEILKLPFAGLAPAFIIMMGGLFLLRKSAQKKIVLIEIIENKTIDIYYNDKKVISSPITDLLIMDTIHRRTTTADVQALLKFRNKKINLYSTLDRENKANFDAFIIYLENNFQFICKKAPLSLRYSKHYVEYFNPSIQ
jgi:hypothetical protein